ncbi:MAG: hypothetical protein HC927_11270, partial [Deltaproteobacteria bacterium]|nr:hypothetical protein [Deltaproteobacteria bacterium]
MRRRPLLLGLTSLAAIAACRDQPPNQLTPPPRPSDPLHQPPPLDLPIGDEPPQDLATFVSESLAPLSANHRTLELLPIGEYPRGLVVEYERTHLVRSPDPELLRRFAEAWFGLPVRVLPAMSDAWLETQPSREHAGFCR